MRLAIVEIAVLPDQVHLGLEGVRICVVIVKQALPDGPEVAWLSHYIEVIRDVELDWIDRVEEVVGAFEGNAAHYDL